MSHRIALFCAFFAPIVLGACASPQSTPTAWQPDREARIRVYWGATVYFHYNTACMPKQGLWGGYPEPSRLVSKPGFSAMVNKTVGMPLPSDAYRYYQEWIVPGGQPLTISAQITEATMINAKAYWATYAPGAGTFVPEAGRDYEVLISGPGSAQIHLRRLLAGTAGVAIEPVAISEAHACN
ncbi:hypothetical protein [Burkholderia cepacia]|uniref:hypothetical protein n=1 Tax=Burkholderia cepacia TaxID=292 RepID=UPI002FE2EF3D